MGQIAPLHSICILSGIRKGLTIRCAQGRARGAIFFGEKPNHDPQHVIGLHMDTSLRASRIVETDRSTIEAELSRLLMEKKFSGAPQMSAFLHYIVSQTLDGNGDRIKAYTVGVDALGKPHTFDAQSDPSVRVLALRLRKTLAGLYESNPECHAYIGLKVGTYVPEFFKAGVTSLSLADAADTPSSQSREHQKLDSGSTTPDHVRPEPVNVSQPQTNINVARQLLPSLSDSVFRTSGSIVLSNKSTQALFLSILFVFLLFWVISGAHSNTYMHKLSASVPLPVLSSDAIEVVADSASHIQKQTPTLYLIDDFGQSRHLRQVSMLLGSSVAQNGSLNVIRVSRARVPTESLLGDYHMVLNELLVGSNARIDAQVLRLASGVVVASSTMIFDNTTESFTLDEVQRLEELAKNISDASGPLLKDFCMNYKPFTSASCLHQEMSELSYLLNGSDAV